MSIASTPYRLAQAHVLIGVAQTPEGPQPLFTEVEGRSCVVAYTDVDEAKADLPDTHRLFSIEVAELLRQLPPHAGLLVDPRSPAPVHVPPDQKDAVVDAGKPFPAQAPVRIGDPADEPVALVEAARAAAPERARSLRRAWRTWYQVADAPPKLLLVYDIDGRDGADAEAADLLVGAARSTDYEHPLLVMALDDLPREHREWLLANTPPFYERP